MGFILTNPAEERWHSLDLPWGLPRDAPPPPPESVQKAFVRSYADVVTKFSRLDGLPIFITHGASLARFARGSSANTYTTYITYNTIRLLTLLTIPILTVLNKTSITLQYKAQFTNWTYLFTQNCMAYFTKRHLIYFLLTVQGRFRDSAGRKDKIFWLLI